jgi:hypothetical protein
MTLSLYEGRKRQGSWPAVFIFVNLLFAATCIFWWGAMAFLVADAMSWATWGNISRAAPDFLAYPFILLWALPLLGSCLAWVGTKTDNERMAVMAGLFPQVLLGLILCWYWLAPLHWR